MITLKMSPRRGLCGVLCFLATLLAGKAQCVPVGTFAVFSAHTERGREGTGEFLLRASSGTPYCLYQMGSTKFVVFLRSRVDMGQMKGFAGNEIEVQEVHQCTFGTGFPLKATQGNLWRVRIDGEGSHQPAQNPLLELLDWARSNGDVVLLENGEICVIGMSGATGPPLPQDGARAKRCKIRRPHPSVREHGREPGSRLKERGSRLDMPELNQLDIQIVDATSIRLMGAATVFYACNRSWPESIEPNGVTSRHATFGH